MIFMRTILFLSLASLAFSHCAPSLHFFNVTTGIDFLTLNSSAEVPITSLPTPFEIRAELCRRRIHSVAFRFLGEDDFNIEFEVDDRVDNTEPYTSGIVGSGTILQIKENLSRGESQVLAVAGFDEFKGTGNIVKGIVVTFTLPIKAIETPSPAPAPRILGFFPPPSKAGYK